MKSKEPKAKPWNSKKSYIPPVTSGSSELSKVHIQPNDVTLLLNVQSYFAGGNFGTFARFVNKQDKEIKTSFVFSRNGPDLIQILFLFLYKSIFILL